MDLNAASSKNQSKDRNQENRKISDDKNPAANFVARLKVKAEQESRDCWESHNFNFNSFLATWSNYTHKNFYSKLHTHKCKRKTF